MKNQAKLRSVFSNFKSEISNRTAGPAPPPAASSQSAIRNLQSAIDEAVARSFLCRFLAQAFDHPSPESWSHLTNPAVQQDFQTAVRTLGIAHDESFIAQLQLASLEPFTDDYVATFGHAARGLCPMNEIEYGDLKADALFQPHRLADLGAFYRAFGLEVTEGAAERHDHICLELEFMSVLAAKEAFALEQQLDDEAFALCRDAEKKFLREHLGRWTPAFTRRLARLVAADSVLRALADFTRAFIEAECARFGLSPGSEDLLLRPVDEASEALCASCGIANLPPGALHVTVQV